MTTSEWKELMEEFLEGVEREFRSSTPTKTKFTLDAFRRRLNGAGVIRSRKRFERELDTFLKSEPFARAATERHLLKKIRSTVAAADAALNRALPLLAKYKVNRRGKAARFLN